MNLHQVLTGAVNPGDNCFSVGSINSVPFTVSYFKLWKNFPPSYLGLFFFSVELLLNGKVESRARVQYGKSSGSMKVLLRVVIPYRLKAKSNWFYMSGIFKPPILVSSTALY